MISAVILSHNDQSTIERAIKRVLWCDEIVVIDDNSIDRTVNEANKLGARVLSRALQNDFSAQRNFGLTKASGEWVLFVDSDEEVSEELAEEIQQKIKKPGNIYGFYMKRNDFFLGTWLKHGETAGVWLLRLAKKDSGLWKRPVHEVWEIKGETDRLKIPLLHYPHPSVAQFLDEINWYSTVAARYLVDSGQKIPWWQIPVYPAAKFIQNYFLKLGFLDGTPGAIVAIMMSFHSFLTRSKAYLLIHKPPPAP